MNHRNQIARISLKLLPLLMILIAVWDLRTEIQIIFEHFTFTALIFCINHHPFSVLVLMASPSILANIFKKNGSRSV